MISTMTFRLVVSHFTVLASAGIVDIAVVGGGTDPPDPSAGKVVCIAAVWTAPLHVYVGVYPQAGFYV